MNWDRQTAPNEAIIGIPLVEGGYRLAPYNDGYGYWTIGAGSRTMPYGGPVTSTSRHITLAEAQALFATELKPRMAAITAAIPQPLTTGQAAALLSWVYECGTSVLQNSPVAAMIRANRYDLAVNHMAVYCEARNPTTHILEPSLGIMRRRKFEALMWNGMDPNTAFTEGWKTTYAEGMAAYNLATTQQKAWNTNPSSIPTPQAPTATPTTPPVKSSFLSSISAFFAALF